MTETSQLSNLSVAGINLLFSATDDISSSLFVENGPDWSKLVLIGRWGPCLFSHDGQWQPP